MEENNPNNNLENNNNQNIENSSKNNDNNNQNNENNNNNNNNNNEIQKKNNEIKNEKHLLQSSWTFYYDKKLKSKNYEENLCELGSFNTIEDFWRFYIYLKKPYQITNDFDIHLFRSGLKPMWENFPKGGCFIKKLKRTEENKSNNLLGRMWEELIFTLIGENFEDPEVVGIVLSIRQREDIIAIWTKDSKNHSLRYKIAEKLKQIWVLDPNSSIEYKNHSASMKDGSTYRGKVEQINIS